MAATPLIPLIQTAITMAIIALYWYARHSVGRAQELLHAQLVHTADYAPTLEQIAVVCQGNQEPDRLRSILEQTDLSAVPALQKATEEALHRLQKRQLHSAFVSPPPPPAPSRHGISPPTVLAWVILAIAGVDLVFLGPRIAHAWQPAGASQWLGALLALTAGIAVAAAVDLMKKDRVLSLWRTEVARASARLVTDHLLTPLYRQERWEKCQEVMRLIGPVTAQATDLSVALAEEVRDPINRLREQVRRLSQHVETLLTSGKLCTESLEAREQLPEYIAGVLGGGASTCEELANTAEKQRDQRAQEIQVLLHHLARVASELTENALEEQQAQELLAHTPQALEELLATLRHEGTQRFCRVTAESLTATLAWSRDVAYATTDLLEGLDGIVRANEQSKAYAHEAWTLQRQLKSEITNLLQQG
jgi:hypothetical protein